MTYRRTSRGAEWPLLLCVLLDLFGFGMVIADVQLRAQSETSAGWPTGAIVGAALASTFVVQSLVSPFWGRLSDRLGRKAVLVACTSLSALAMAVYGLGGSLAAIFASRIIAGIGGANVAVGQAMLADRYSASARTAALGRLGAAISLGLIAGPPVGGLMIHSFGYHVMAFSAAAASGVGVLCLAVVLKEGPKHRSDESAERKTGSLRLLRDFPALRPYVLIAIVAWLSLATLEGTFARLIQQLFGYDQRQFGMLFGFEALVGFLVQAKGIAYLLPKIRESSLLRSAYLLQGIGLALNPAAALFQSHVHPLLVLFTASTLFAVGGGLANPTVNGICSSLTPAERQGELFGLLQGTRSIGFVAGPVLGGLLFDRWAPGPYLFAGAVCVMAALLVPRMPNAEQSG